MQYIEKPTEDILLVKRTFIYGMIHVQKQISNRW